MLQVLNERELLFNRHTIQLRTFQHFVQNVNEFVHKIMSTPTFERVLKSCLFQCVHVLGVQCKKKGKQKNGGEVWQEIVKGRLWLNKRFFCQLINYLQGLVA